MDSYTTFYSNADDQFKSKQGSKVTPLRNQYHIWKMELPSVKDVSTSLLKRGIIIIIGLIYLVNISLLTFNIFLALGAMIVYYLIFVLIFHNQIFSLTNHLAYKSPNPFKKYNFWQYDLEKSIIFLTSLREQVLTGIKLFQVNILPENVKANLDRFISAMASQYIPFSYQVIQKPILSSLKEEDISLTDQRFQTILYFSLFYDLSGRVTLIKLQKITEKLNRYSISLKNNFLANFHHYKVVELEGIDLANALCTFILKKKNASIEHKAANLQEENILPSQDLIRSESFRQKESFSFLLNVIFISVILISIAFLFILLHIPLILILGLSFLIGALFIYYWAPQIFPLILNRSLFAKSSQILQKIDIFSDVHFFKARGVDTIFYETKDGFIGGIKQINLSYATAPVIALPYKFYQAIIQQGINFAYTFQALPTSYEKFTNHFSHYLNKKEWTRMRNQLTNAALESNWLGQRKGIWRTMMTVSSSYTIVAPKISIEIVELIENVLQRNITILQNAFMSNFSNCHFVLLKSKRLETGILFEALKNNRFRRDGSHLSYLLFQGTSLSALIWISDLFKKGLETKIATEFNSPLQLESFITMGQTINTETLNQEVPVGLTKVQLDNLLITNGKFIQQQLISMKIVVELVKKQYPSLIFDFTGEWTRLIHQFQGTPHEDSFLFYKIGKTFNLDLVHSGIAKYDPNNLDYLDYMLEGYRLVFKKDDRTIEVFRNTLMKNLDQGSELSSSTVALNMDQKPNWLKRQEPAINSVIDFIHEFTREEMNLFSMLIPSTKTQNIIKELLPSEKTIIIDLSFVNGLDKKVFLMLVILAKIIHYANNGITFIQKSIILPHIDIAFDANFVDKNIHYGKINKFFEPLRKFGFGLICLASQIRYLHSSLFADFDNVISFKATDARDIATLKNVMGLDAVHGTGIYSKTRNESYQVKYLMNMRFKEALMKRDDIYQPFPIETDWDLIEKSGIMTWDEIVAYMRQQGYDLESAERRLIAQTKKTIFQKDFGEYANCIEPIIAFLGDLRTIDQIGNLFAETIKKELKTRLDIKLSQLSQDNKRKKHMRDDIFKILLKHEYLKEHHPAQASGSESVRTSYYVGPQFDLALEDYINIKNQIPPDIEIIQKESEYAPNLPGSITSKSSIDPFKLKEMIARQIGDTLILDLFEIYRAINHKDYRMGLEKAKNFISHFIFQLYNDYYDVDYLITKKDLDDFIFDITNSKNFPFNYEEFRDYMTLCEQISFNDNDLEKVILTLYKQLETFHNKIKSYIYSN